MQDDETTEQGCDQDGITQEVTGTGVDFGDYTVIGSDIQIVIGGRLIVHPGD